MTDLELFPTTKTIAPLCLCRHTLDRHVEGVGCTDCNSREWPCAVFQALTSGDAGGGE